MIMLMTVVAAMAKLKNCSSLQTIGDEMIRRSICVLLLLQIVVNCATEQRNAIIAGLNEIQSATCIKFVQRTNQANYVQVERANSGCWSYVGMLKGKQVLNLQVPGCIYHMGIMHEFLHALGFYHMQSASDRDNYVTILLHNVASANQHNYNKYSTSTVTDFGVTYDYQSIMHYYDTAFSMNGEKTIITRDPAYQNIIGRVNHLSRSDIDKINRMYSC